MFKNKSTRIIDVPFAIASLGMGVYGIILAAMHYRASIAMPIFCVLYLVCIVMRESLRKDYDAQQSPRTLLALYLCICGAAIGILLIGTIYLCIE